MTERLEQQYCIKFCQKLGDSQAETIQKIQRVFGEDAMGITQIKEWYNIFTDGHTSVESDAHSGRPSTSRNDELIDQVRALVMQDRHVTVRELAEEVGISTGLVHSILTFDLAMRRVSAKFVPKLLTMEQKQLRLEVSQDMLDYANSDPEFLNIVITGDESCVYGYDPETKAQSSQSKHSTSPRPKKARQVRRNVKVMLTVFFDSRGVVHHEYAPQGKTLIKNTTWKSFVAFEMLCGARDRTCGHRERGSCIVTSHQLVPRN
jgi:histone-lysine N-methyltransferase SETMAR